MNKYYNIDFSRSSFSGIPPLDIESFNFNRGLNQLAKNSYIKVQGYFVVRMQISFRTFMYVGAICILPKSLYFNDLDV